MVNQVTTVRERFLVSGFHAIQKSSQYGHSLSQVSTKMESSNYCSVIKAKFLEGISMED